MQQGVCMLLLPEKPYVDISAGTMSRNRVIQAYAVALQSMVGIPCLW